MTATGLTRRVVGVQAMPASVLGPPEAVEHPPGLGRRVDQVWWVVDEDGAMPGQLIITIDGPAGTGKSSVARVLAQRLGLAFLDTGAMYRAAALIAIESDIDPRDPARHLDLVDAVEAAHMHFDWKADPPELICAGRSVVKRIREADVTRTVSPVAAIAALRRSLVRKQRAIAATHPRLVSEGRDQGSVVFPDAAVKFYLHATPEVRARRRLDQLRAAHTPEFGSAAVPEVEQLLNEIIARDTADSSRADGPLICPPDAERVDTSGMAFDEVVLTLERFVREHVRGMRAAAFPVPGSAPAPVGDWEPGAGLTALNKDGSGGQGAMVGGSGGA